jgi:transketolase C-terminal domain/subunit
VGIAEQSLVDVAVGLAYSGKIPFANTFAFLFATRFSITEQQARQTMETLLLRRSQTSLDPQS